MINFQIVVMENIKNQWSDPLIRKLHNEIIGIKLGGYKNVYGPKVISADKADYFGSHLIFCQKNGKDLKPLFAYKSVTREMCKQHLMDLPCIDMILKDAAPSTYKALMKIIKEAEMARSTISYDYSWAQDPQFHKLKSNYEKEYFQRIMMMIIVNHHRTYNIDEMLTCGAVKVKTDTFFEQTGLKEICNDTTFNQTALNYEQAKIFHARKFSDAAYKACEEFKVLWNNRLELLAHDEEDIQIAA